MGGIRGRGPHTVIVQNRVKSRKNGQSFYSASGDPVVVDRCHVQSVREWATAEEDYTNGLSLLTMFRVFSRSWPGTVDSLIYFDGGEYETVGTPQYMDGSPRTKHWVVTIKWLGEAEPPALPVPPVEGDTDGSG